MTDKYNLLYSFILSFYSLNVFSSSFTSPKPNYTLWNKCLPLHHGCQVSYEEILTLVMEIKLSKELYLANVTSNRDFLLVFASFSKHAKIKHPTTSIVKLNYNISVINNIRHLSCQREKSIC